MKYGLLDDGRRVSADDAKKEDSHFCPACYAQLVLKQGEINDWHFAHKKQQFCDAFTDSGMSKWHSLHQSEFPEPCREVRLEDETGKVRIADIMIEWRKKLIVEFQHSPIDNETFEERISFYRKFGLLIWVFDLEEPYLKERICWKESRWKRSAGFFLWKHASRILGKYDIRKLDCDVFVQLSQDLYCRVTWNKSGLKYFSGERLTHQGFMKYLLKRVRS